MKKIISILFVGLFFTACAKKEEPQSGEQADYAKTHEELINNPEKDSAALADTINARQGMPPQTKENPAVTN